MKKCHLTKLKFTILLTLIFLFAFAYIGDYGKRIAIPAYEQRQGDAALGLDYLINGDYVSSGIPYGLIKSFLPSDSNNILNRTGKAAFLPPSFNLVKHENGTEIAAPNCLTCHGEYLNGEYIIGLGNNTFDYTRNVNGLNIMMSNFVANRYGKDSKEWGAFKSFSGASNALSNQLTTDNPFVNPADKLTAVLIAHRQKSSLTWTDSTLLEIPNETIPTDVPAWWLLKKKNAMFYTGIGRGDFSKFLMASSILTLQDSAEARRIDHNFPDVLAWINQLDAPQYPGQVDSSKLERGRKLFDLNCSSCHGTYNEEPYYPNLLIPLDEIETDPHLSLAYTDSLYQSFIDWYEDSWFNKAPHAGELVIEPGYVAPPLDGVWATGPYFHNASVPTVESILFPEKRPKYWKRNSDNYDMNGLGIDFTVVDTVTNKSIYDTTLKYYSNKGHNFGLHLNEIDRYYILEYLKTL